MGNKAHSRVAIEELSLRSFGVVDSAELEFTSGLTVLTGETGAGKTMVLSALNALMGGKVDPALVRTGAERAVISGQFHLGSQGQLLAEEIGAEVSDGSVILTRTITEGGKSRITIGGALATLNQAGELCDLLIQVHAQSSSARLLKSSYQRELLDRFGNTHSLREQYQRDYDQCSRTLERIEDMRSSQAHSAREIERLEEFLVEFKKVAPGENEFLEVSQELNRLEYAEAIYNALAEAMGVLENEEFSPLAMLHSSRHSLEGVRGKDAHLDDLMDSLIDHIANLEDLSSGLRRYFDDFSADPARFEYLRNRLSQLSSLIKRFGSGDDKKEAYARLFEEAMSASERVTDLRGGEERIQTLHHEFDVQLLELRKSGLELSRARTSAADALGHKITGEIKDLSMPHSSVVIQVSASAAENWKDFTVTGIDEVNFLFRSHPGSPEMLLAKSASGGELSRVMLAIEVTLAESENLGCYIFDEVDAGIGGKAALQVGNRLHQLAQSAQVVVVTHLAQVAVWADSHFLVEKDESGAVTSTSIRQISGNERESEIARMLSGQPESDLAVEHAAELLNLVAQTMIG